MNPKTQECFGYYGYGVGYFARESQLLARVNKEEAHSFCDSCPKRYECWQALKVRVENEYPEDVVLWNVQLEQVSQSGDPQAGGKLATQLAAAGTPDPWMRDMLSNINKGIKDASLH